MNSAMIRKQKRQARLDFIASAIGWSTIAAINYLLFTGLFFMLHNPLSTLINQGVNAMKHWEIEHNGEHIRIEWNESSTFNLQTAIGGEWVDYHCFTCYGIDTEQEALEHAYEILNESIEDLI